MSKGVIETYRGDEGEKQKEQTKDKGRNWNMTKP